MVSAVGALGKKKGKSGSDWVLELYRPPPVNFSLEDEAVTFFMKGQRNRAAKFVVFYHPVENGSKAVYATAFRGKSYHNGNFDYDPVYVWKKVPNLPTTFRSQKAAVSFMCRRFHHKKYTGYQLAAYLRHCPKFFGYEIHGELIFKYLETCTQ